MFQIYYGKKLLFFFDKMMMIMMMMMPVSFYTNMPRQTSDIRDSDTLAWLGTSQLIALSPYDNAGWYQGEKLSTRVTSSGVTRPEIEITIMRTRSMWVY